MDRADLMNLSIEQSARALGDPTSEIFNHMYTRFPALSQFRKDDHNWEHAMVQEALTTIMQSTDDQSEVLDAITMLSKRHGAIGIDAAVFGDIYDTVYDVMRPHFFGPYRDEMMKTWDDCIASIKSNIQARI